jgi:hypothetical protein
MSEKKEPRQATIVSAAEAAQNPRAVLKLTKDMAAPPEVEGQYRMIHYPKCPGCGTQYRNLPESDYYRYYVCDFCGTIFKI